MFLYNKETRFIVGPITNNEIRGGSFRSDLIDGHNLEISIFIPIRTDSLDVNIGLFDHGIVSRSNFTSSFGFSLPCQVNVACEEGDGWECQINSVCLINDDEGIPCSGVVINNECCDLTPFILTANHCVSENLGEYLFRFNYQTLGCINGTEPPVGWVTYSGAELIANWDDTDFSLIELAQKIRPIDRITFSGWDRRDIIPPEVTMIHHPRGDVKKISFNDSPFLEIDTITSTDGSIVLPSGNAIRANFNQTGGVDFGTLEGGSSGCPWYDDNRRIIGHQSMSQQASCELLQGTLAGRFFSSWTGGGDSATGLQDWLGGIVNPNTMECMTHPFVNGIDFLCEAPKSITLTNNIPCVKNVNWEVEPSHLFSSPTMGSGATATLVPNSNTNGEAKLTFTLSSEGCNDAMIEQEFWVGKPNVVTNIQYPVLCFNQFEEMIILESPGATSYFLESLSPSIWLSTNTPVPNLPLTIIGNQLGYHQLRLTVSNECGSSSSLIDIEVVRCSGESGYWLKETTEDIFTDEVRIELFPNPTQNTINISYTIPSGYNDEAKINILSIKGRELRKFISHGGYHQLNIADLPSGLYIIRIEIEGKKFHNKILKL